MGLKGRRVSVNGTGALAAHCIALLAAEGAELLDAEADLRSCDTLVAIAPHAADMAALQDLDDATTLGAWEHVTDLAAQCRTASAGMAERGYGRIVWVGPLETKLTRDDPAADLDAVVGLGALGLLKAMAGELGPDGVTCNSVLWDGRDMEAAGAAVVFFASEASSYVSGTALSVDGGQSGSVF
jgi:NAD(P)-dependent dehydrogenase (short-subunit alcohol dehydrogenase family)